MALAWKAGWVNALRGSNPYPPRVKAPSVFWGPSRAEHVARIREERGRQAERRFYPPSQVCG